MTNVSVVCTDLLMEGFVSAVAAWQSDGNSDCQASVPPLGVTGVCPSQTSKCKAEIVPFEVSKKDVDLMLTKTNVGLTPGFVPTPGQYIDYTIRVDNLPYLNDHDENIGTPDQNTCYRSSGYVIEDELPSYLKGITVTSALTQAGSPLLASFKCVDANGVTIPCDYGSLYQIKVENSLPTISSPEPNINDPIPASTCTAQWHTITLRVQYDDSNPRDIAPASIYNKACVNGFQFDPWGGAYQGIDPITGEYTVIDASGNNCDDDNVITEVDLVSFSAHPEGSAMLVEWETATERDNLGFNLYRATSPDGERTKLNAALIPSFAPGGNLGGSYAYTDIFDLQPGTVYYYWLEDMDMSGKLTLHGPISTRLPAMLLPIKIYLPSIIGGN